jgi:hypothetical protein
MIKTISAVCVVSLAIALGAASTVQAGTVFSGIVTLVNYTPAQQGGLGGVPPDTYEDVWADPNVHLDKTLSTTEIGGGAVLGATAYVNTHGDVTGNKLGQFGMSTYAQITVPLGAANGDYEASANMNASIQDTWYLIAPKRFASLRVRGTWKVNGELGADIGGHSDDGSVSASAASILRFSGTGVTPNLQARIRKVTDFPDEFIPTPKVVSLDMVFRNGVGTPYNFVADDVTNAQVEYVDQRLLFGGASASANLDFGHTFTWGGIDSVSDADTGEEITDWTLTSDSGFDWAHPAAPEPSSLVTALTAISILLPVFYRRTVRDRFAIATR